LFNATCVQTITIENQAPVLDCTNLDTTIGCNDSRNENDLPTPTVTDDCSDAGTVSLTFVDDETGLDACGDSGIILRTWTATDQCGLTATCVQTITIENQAPQLVCLNLDRTISCSLPRGENDLPRPTVTDDCTPQNEIQLTFIDDESGLDDCGDSGVIIRTWTATDECGLTATCVQTITITNNPPVLDCADLNTTITCNDPRGENDLPRPIVTDDCTPQNEIQLTFVDDETGLDDCGGQGTFTRTWTATDACGLTATCVQTITITNEAPVLNCDNLDQTIACTDARGENDLPRPTVTDDCTPANQIQLTFVDDESGLDDCGDSGVILRTWTATDECGLTSTCVQTITITNNPPTLVCVEEAITITCNDPRGEDDLPRPTVTDDCSDTNEITLTFVDDESGLDEPLRMKHQF